MSTFTAVNSVREFETHSLGRVQESIPSITSRPRPREISVVDDVQIIGVDESSIKTPTRDSFAGVLDGQRPPSSSHLSGSSNNKRPTEGFPSSHGLDGGQSQLSMRPEDLQDVEMGDSDDDAAVSENEEEVGDSGRPSKKKKGQRFFCTDYPPCKLSFTRSEHLARHIRKHTGERPFQCHCARRFSRLDNLRQHAQTVHVNEEIPNDSLAATGARFQRQVRNDRVRPGGSRSRASTMSSQTSHGRGHSRNLSTSSIGSTTSSVSYRDDGRRRPPPLVVATHRSSQPSLSIDTFRSPPDSPGSREFYQGYSTQSPGDYSTPTSATYSTGPGSPRFPTGFRSPGSGIAQPGVFWDGRSPGRRLSVPSGVNPFQSPGAQVGHGYRQSHYSPLTSSHSSTFSGMNSVLGSPTSSIFSPIRPFGPQETELKRRTWHPDSRPNVNSPLANSSMAYLPSNLRRPTLSQNHSMTYGTRLPGIESFDRRPSTPPIRQTSPMQVDTSSRPPIFPGPVEHTPAGPDHQRGMAEWDMSLHQNLNNLGIDNAVPPAPEIRMRWPLASQDPAGGYSPYRPQQRVSMDATYQSSTPRLSVDQQRHMAIEQARAPPSEPVHTQQQPPSQPPPPPPPETPRKNKRQGWYAGPPSANRNILTNRPSPEDSSSSEGVATPSTSSVGETNPSIRNSNGWLDEITNPGPGTTLPTTLENQKIQTYPPNMAGPAAGPGPATAYQAAARTYSLPSNGRTIIIPSADDAVMPTINSSAGRNGSNMLRLEALVAVATSEEK
ncbi:MAG: hypothetical protein M1816_004707 [Peltula sp. TS41687]|nr:MAG: hypothetical protein M1816_004707 [Peltula sp. TS41687]